MKRFSMLIAVLALAMIAASVPLLVAQAAPVAGVGSQEAPFVAPLDFDGLLATFKNLTGVAMLIAVLVNVLKKAGAIDDGKAGAWAAGFNLVALIALFVGEMGGYGSYVPVVDEQAGNLSNVITVVLGFVYQLYVSRRTHDAVLAGLPVIGTSHSNRVAGDALSAEVTLLERQ